MNQLLNQLQKGLPFMEHNLPDLPGIVTQTGLTMTGGKPDFFLKMLKKFASSYASAAADISQTIADQNFESSVLKAHSIKGIAGTLGANKLHAVAGDLESALRKDPLNVDAELLEKFTGELLLVIEGIKANLTLDA